MPTRTISSISITHGPGHDHLQVFVKGALTGMLTVGVGDGNALAAELLGLDLPTFRMRAMPVGARETRYLVSDWEHDTDWTADKGEVLHFARGLTDAGALPTRARCMHYFEKPQKWTAEHTRWVAAGRPAYSRETARAWDVVLGIVGESAGASS
jgi:hypothetical protein